MYWKTDASRCVLELRTPNKRIVSFLIISIPIDEASCTFPDRDIRFVIKDIPFLPDIRMSVLGITVSFLIVLDRDRGIDFIPDHLCQLVDSDTTTDTSLNKFI